MWAGEEHFFCEAPRPNRADDPVIPPSKIFDNVYIIGIPGTVCVRDSNVRGIAERGSIH